VSIQIYALRPRACWVYELQKGRFLAVEYFQKISSEDDGEEQSQNSINIKGVCGNRGELFLKVSII